MTSRKWISGYCLGAVLALGPVLLIGSAGGPWAQTDSTDPVEVDKEARDAAIRRILEDRAASASPLALAVAGTHRSLTVSLRLAVQAREDLDQGVAPRDSEALQMLALERHNLGVAYDVIQTSLDERRELIGTRQVRTPRTDREQSVEEPESTRPAAPAGRTEKTRSSEAASRGSRSPAFRHVERVIELQENLEAAIRSGADSRRTANLLRDIQEEAEQALSRIRREPPRVTGIFELKAPQRLPTTAETDTERE